jgi:hypothetical protein
MVRRGTVSARSVVDNPKRTKFSLDEISHVRATDRAPATSADNAGDVLDGTTVTESVGEVVEDRRHLEHPPIRPAEQEARLDAARTIVLTEEFEAGGDLHSRSTDCMLGAEVTDGRRALDCYNKAPCLWNSTHRQAEWSLYLPVCSSVVSMR